MKKAFLFILAIAGYCSARAQTTLVDSFICDGVYRSYTLYVPTNYTAGSARPLILNFHGLGSNMLEQYYYSNFIPIADTAGFLMAFPQGLSAQGETYWNVGIPLTPATNDVKFASALIDTISRRYSIDAQRVYSTGMSLGGYMSHYLALNLNNRIAAIASVAGTIYPGVYTAANPGRAVPMMQVHGTADPTVPYAGNGVGINIDTLVRFWVKNDGCNTTPAHTSVPDINHADSCTAEHYVYGGGHNGATVEFYKINGGEHTWPGSPFIIGVTNQDFSASSEIWRFFRQYRLGQFLGVPAVAPAANMVSVYPNPCYDVLHLKSATVGTAVLTDMAGRECGRTTGNEINMRGITPGIYLLTYTSGYSKTMIRVVKQ